MSRSYYGIVAPVLSDCNSGLCIGTFFVVGAPLVMLEINNIEFGYDRPLVTGLSFDVPGGEIKLLHGLSGPRVSFPHEVIRR